MKMQTSHKKVNPHIYHHSKSIHLDLGVPDYELMIRMSIGNMHVELTLTSRIWDLMFPC